MFDNYDAAALTRRNNGYIKNFLAKPMTIVLAILFGISGIISISSFSESAESFSYIIDSLPEEYGFLGFALTVMRYTGTFAPLILSIGLIVMFAQSQDHNPDKAPTGGLGTFLAGAIVYAVYHFTLSAVLIYSIIELINLMSEYSRYSSSGSSEANTILFVLILLDAIVTMYGGGIISFASSIKASATQPSLKKNGAVSFGIANFLLALAIIIGMSYISDQLGDYSVFSTLLGNTSDEFTFSTFLSISLYTISGIYAFTYNSHITMAGDGGINIPSQNTPYSSYNYNATPGYQNTP